MGRPQRRGGDGGLGMRSIRRIRWTRTVSWVIMKKPPRVACMDTRHLRRLLASEQVLMRFAIYDRTSVSFLILFVYPVQEQRNPLAQLARPHGLPHQGIPLENPGG